MNHTHWIVCSVLLAGALGVRADHTCWMPSAEHVNSYSNMLAAARIAGEYADKADEAFRQWKESSAELAADAQEMSSLRVEYQTLVEDYRRAMSTARPSLINEPDNLRNVLQSLVSITGRVDMLKGRFDAQSGRDGWAAAKRECDRAAATFGECETMFRDKDVEAQRIRLHGIRWECVLNLYQENFIPIKTKFESIRTTLDNAGKEARGAEDGAKSAESDIRSRLTEISSLPQRIAESLGVQGVSTADGLIAVLTDWSAPRVTVRFRSQGMDLPDGTRLLKKGIDPLMKPEDPVRPGLVFLYWSMSGTREKFADEKWNKPLDQNLDLNAVWGFEVRVSGLDHVFLVPRESEGVYPSLASVFADAQFVAFLENPRPAPPPGQRLAGWQDAETKMRVDEGTLLSKSLTLSPVYEEIRHTITWQDADGTYLNETVTSHSSPPKPEKLPDDRDGFHYTHWSTEPDGERWGGWGKPLDADLVLFAVRDADYIVRFCLRNGSEIGQAGFKKGAIFNPALAPLPPEQDGSVFVEWRDEGDANFSGRPVDGNYQLIAFYRPESSAETVERWFRPLRDRFPPPVLAGADVALAILLAMLLFAGHKPRAPRKAGPVAVEAAPEAEASAGEAPPSSETPSDNA